MFKAIIVKPFHKALDVMFATARYRNDVKVLSPAASRILTNSRFMVRSKVLSAGLSWRKTRLYEGKTDRE